VNGKVIRRVHVTLDVTTVIETILTESDAIEAGRPPESFNWPAEPLVADHLPRPAAAPQRGTPQPPTVTGLRARRG
jgi:hypothetical protein